MKGAVICTEFYYNTGAKPRLSLGKKRVTKFTEANENCLRHKYNKRTLDIVQSAICGDMLFFIGIDPGVL